MTPAELWSTLSHTERYREWWPWLRTFAIDGRRWTTTTDVLATGRTAHVVIQAPLPYQLHCDVRVDDAVRDQRLVTTVDGDLQGPARLELRPVEGGTEARLAWEFELRAPLLRTLVHRRSTGDGVGARPDRRARSRAVRGSRARASATV